MNSASAIARTGMSAALTTLGVGAHNIANQHTPDFRRQQVVPETQAAGGVVARVTQDDLVQPDGGAPVADLVQQRVASYAFKANLLVLQSDQRVLGNLLDVRA